MKEIICRGCGKRATYFGSGNTREMCEELNYKCFSSYKGFIFQCLDCHTKTVAAAKEIVNLTQDETVTLHSILKS